MDTVRVDINQRELDALLRSPDARELLLEVSRPHVGEAQAAAPRRTGAGAESIHAEAVLEDGKWEALVSWDRRHFYMYFHEVGTRQLSARPFLVPSFE